MNDRGFGSVLLLSTLALLGLMCVATADAANVLVARARAQTAADASALAAASAQWTFGSYGLSPAVAAREEAERDGASLESCDCPAKGKTATVVVSVATRIRMLGVAPPRVTARADASLDVQRMFDAPRTD